MSTTEKKKRKKAFDEGMQVVSEVFDKKLTPELIEIYFRALEEYNAQQIKSAFERAVVSLRWFPRPADLKDMISGGEEVLGLIAHEAATLVLETLRTVGSYESVNFDPVTNAVIVRVYGGWDKLGGSLKVAEAKWFLREFTQHYKNFTATGIHQIEHLAGIFELDNIARNYPNFISPPIDLSARITQHKTRVLLQ